MKTLQEELTTLCETIEKRKFFEDEDDDDLMIERLIFQQKACDLFRVPIDLLKTKTRKREVVNARQLCMWYEKKTSNQSLSLIGWEYGGKDHATVLHACRTIENFIETKDTTVFPLIEKFVKFTKMNIAI